MLPNNKRMVCLLVIAFLVSINCMGQRTQQKYSTDSMVSMRRVNDLATIFTLTQQQRVALYRAGVTASRIRSNVFTQYWKTDSFRIKLAAANFLKDSLYRSVLGDKKLGIYRDTLSRRRKSW